MNKLLKVAKREYVETVKTKTFILSILLMPLLMVGMVFISMKAQKKAMSGPRPDKLIAVVNLCDEISEEVKDVFERYNRNETQRRIVVKQNISGGSDPDARIQEFKDDVRNGELDGFLLINSDVLESNGRMEFYSKNEIDMIFISTVRRLANEAVFNTRCRLNDLAPELISEIRRWVPMDQVDLGADSEKKRNELAILMTPLFFLFLMFFGIVTVSQGLLMSVIEEKTTRVIEVLLASVSPFQLMAGKITGQSAVGLTLVGLYGTAAYVTATIRGMGEFLTGSMAVYFLVYYILGFLLISSILAAIGSAFNTIKEAQSLMGPVMITFMLPLFFWFYIVQNPQDTISIVLSFIPPMTPMIMMLRIAVVPDLPLFQIIGSIIVLGLSVPIVMWCSGKIFRTGVLMYGKPPSLKELFKWIRYS